MMDPVKRSDLLEGERDDLMHTKETRLFLSSGNVKLAGRNARKTRKRERESFSEENKSD